MPNPKASKLGNPSPKPRLDSVVNSLGLNLVL